MHPGPRERLGQSLHPAECRSDAVGEADVVDMVGELVDHRRRHPRSGARDPDGDREGLGVVAAPVIQMPCAHQTDPLDAIPHSRRRFDEPVECRRELSNILQACQAPPTTAE